jgi:hypothetical protein
METLVQVVHEKETAASHVVFVRLHFESPNSYVCNLTNANWWIIFILCWFFMTPSITTKFQYINSLLFSFLTHYMFRPLQAILRWDIQLDI